MDTTEDVPKGAIDGRLPVIKTVRIATADEETLRRTKPRGISEGEWIRVLLRRALRQLSRGTERAT